MDNPKKYFSLQEAAIYLNVSEKLLIELIKSKNIPIELNPDEHINIFELQTWASKNKIANHKLRNDVKKSEWYLILYRSNDYHYSVIKDIHNNNSVF